MRAWLARLSGFQRIALILTVAAAMIVTFRGFTVSGVGGAWVLLVAALGLAAVSFRRALLWRVRNRLILSYFLFGIVPVVLITAMVATISTTFLGLLASDRLHEALDRRIAATDAAARDLASVLATTDARADWRQQATIFVGQARQRIPGVRVLARRAGETIALPPVEGDDLAAIPDWPEPPFTSGLISLNRRAAVGALAADAPSDVAVFVYLTLDEPTLASLTPLVPAVMAFVEDEDVDVNVTPDSISIDRRAAGQTQVTPTTLSTRLPAARGFWDRTILWILLMKVRAVPGGAGNPGDVVFTLGSRTSLLVSDLLSSSGGPFARIIIVLTLTIGAVLVVVELVALAWSLRLTRTITRSVHDLYEGTEEISRGNLACVIPVRGRDQLSELAGSFNEMTGRIRMLITEVEKKKKIEAELEIARQVQARLFPKEVPSVEGLELAGLCIPSRFVSGDYYDFVPVRDRWTALVLGDVSGKGISAALVMASLQSALHSQLQFRDGQGHDEAESPASLAARLSRQLYDNTPTEKYATFFCSVYDRQTRRLAYTNAGHLAPLLVRKGQIQTLGVGGTVLGLMPLFHYDEQTIELEPGDLLAAFSDGITESEDASGEQFGDARLGELLVQHAKEPLDDIIGTVADRVRAWAHDPESQDDMTILLARQR